MYRTPNTSSSRLHSRYGSSSNNNNNNNNNKGNPLLVARKALFSFKAPPSSEVTTNDGSCSIDLSESLSKRHETSFSFYKYLKHFGWSIRHYWLGILFLIGILSIFIMAYQVVTYPFYQSRDLSLSVHQTHLVFNGQQTTVTTTTPTQSHRQRIILLAGPHKTGTTSIQSNLYSWTRNAQNTIASSVIQNDIQRETHTPIIPLPSWYWPVPPLVSQMESMDTQNFAWTPAKGFYALLEAMRNHTLYRVEDRLLFNNYTFDQVIDMYKVELQHAWDEGYNIVLATEAIDYCIKDKDGQRLLEEFLDVLPDSGISSMNSSTSTLVKDKGLATRDHITVVVTYRSPRVKHLVSIWHQTKKKVEHFRAWMTTTRNELGALDSLALAEMLLNHGLHVILIDSSGIIQGGYDISYIVACDVLGAECTINKTLQGLQSEPVVKNVKVDKNYNLNVNDEELDAMDKVMRQYDCKFQHLMDHPNLTILYPHDLIHNFDQCEPGILEMSRLEMKRQLVEILREKSDEIPSAAE